MSDNIKMNLHLWADKDDYSLNSEPTILVLSKSDIAIKENILKPHTVETFFKHVYIRKANDAIVADSLEEFMTKITDPCHVWQGPQHRNTYGMFTVYSKQENTKFARRVKAHRFAYALAYGFDALPKGILGGDGNQLVLNHLCHNKLCVNPKHLEVITSNENISMEKRKPKND